MLNDRAFSKVDDIRDTRERENNIFKSKTFHWKSFHDMSKLYNLFQHWHFLWSEMFCSSRIHAENNSSACHQTVLQQVHLFQQRSFHTALYQKLQRHAIAVLLKHCLLLRCCQEWDCCCLQNVCFTLFTLEQNISGACGNGWLEDCMWFLKLMQSFVPCIWPPPALAGPKLCWTRAYLLRSSEALNLAVQNLHEECGFWNAMGHFIILLALLSPLAIKIKFANVSWI